MQIKGKKYHGSTPVDGRLVLGAKETVTGLVEGEIIEGEGYVRGVKLPSITPSGLE
jgi:hypothetical protein